jgi:hypothetical protein
LIWKKQKVLAVNVINLVDVNVIIIGIIFESEETTVFECNRISCKGYCDLVAVIDLDFRQGRNKSFWM